MNAGIYKLIFSKRLNALVVVGEICSSQGKAPGTTRATKRSGRGLVQLVRVLGLFSSGALLVSSAWAAPAIDALPTGGQVAQGSASIGQTGAQMDINQASQRAVINWQSFDVGANAKVNIVQPNQAAVLLNRVVTNKPSEIYGKVDANGQVILVNNNGIVFGQDGSASASSFTASTLDINDQDFMAGKNNFTSKGSQGEIVNHGTIEAKNGGYVALLGAKVSNDGKIITHNGSVAMAAADSVAIPITASGKIKIELSAASVNAAVENTKDGVIVTDGGDVYLQAAAANNAMASVKNAGQIDTSGEQAGKAILLADNGEINVDGVITANSSKAANKGGDIIIGRDTETGVLAANTNVSNAKLESKGGFVETSGHQLTVDDAQIKAANWLLDPDNIEITNGIATTGYSAISANTLGTALTDDTTVIINTTAATGNYNAAVNNNGTGKILVTNAITKSAGTGTATLNLIADDSITVNNTISASAGKLNLNLTANNGIAGTGAITLNAGSLTLNTVNASATGILSGVISGTGTTLTKTGAGAVTLTGNNTYTGTTTVNGGTLQIGNGSTTGTLGTGAVSVASGANLNFYRSDVGTTFISNVIAGEGTINLLGTGTSRQSDYSFTGDNTDFTGNINISKSRLAVDNQKDIGSAAVVVNSGASLYVTGVTLTNNLTLAGIGWTEGWGNLGALRLQGATYTGAITLAADARVSAIGVNSPATVSGLISGTGGLEVYATNALQGTTVILTGANTYTGKTTINSLATLQLGNAGNVGSIDSTSGITNNGALVINRNNAVTIAADISGTGSLTQSGTGTTTLTGTNSYSGLTTVSGGTLQVGNGGTTGTLGAGAVALSNNANLAFVRSVDTSITNAITGNGNVSANITTNNAGTAGVLTVNSSNFSVGGKIDLRADGDVKLENSITTSKNTGDAVKLVAGQAYGVTGGVGAINTSLGNVKVTSGKTITVGSGGVAALYSGSIAETTGISGMAASRSGKFRYNSDETKANYTKSLSQSDGSSNSGVNIIYREAPTIEVTAYSYGTGTGNGVLTYNGSTQTGTTGYTDNSATSGVLKNSDVSAGLTGTALYAYNSGVTDPKNAGTYTVTASNLRSDVGYAISYKTGSLVIDKANLTVISGAKTYDGQSSLTVGTSGGTLSFTGVNNEKATISAGSVTLRGKDVAANGQTVTGITANGLTAAANQTLDLNNYNLASVPTAGTNNANNKVDIAKANLTKVTAAKTYDGLETVKANEMIAIVGVNDERFTAASGTAAISDKNVAGTKTVTDLTDLSLTSVNGGATGNYNLSSGLPSQGTNTNNVVINKANLTVTAQAVTKTYDGTTTATGNGLVGTLAGQAAGESVNSAGSQAFTDKNAGTGKTVKASGVTIKDSSNADVTSNYNIDYVDNITSTINKANATVTANSDLTKVYTGVNQSVTGFTASGLVNGETTAVLTGVTASGTGKNAGTYASTATGTDSNYNLSFIDGTLKINKADLTVTAQAVTKTYDGTTTATGNGLVGTLAGQAAGESVNSAGSQAFTDKNAGTGKTVKASGVTIKDSSNADVTSNYNIAYVDNTTSTINKAGLTAIIGSKTYDGTKTLTAGTTGSSLRFAGITVGNATESADIASGSVTIGKQNVADNGSNSVTAIGNNLGTANGATLDLNNYDLSSVPVQGLSNNVTIAQKALTAELTQTVEKTYDGTTSATNLTDTHFSVVGWVTGEGATVTKKTATYASPDVAANPGDGLVSTVLSAADYSANSGTDLANYKLPSVAKGYVGKITSAANPSDIINPVSPVSPVSPVTPLSPSGQGGGRVMIVSAAATQPVGSFNTAGVECSVESPEACECEETLIPGTSVCFVADKKHF